MKRSTLFLIFLWVSGSLGSFANEPVVTAQVDRESANLGDIVIYTIDLYFENGWDFDLAPLEKTFGDAQVLHSKWGKPIRVPETGLQKVTLKASLAWYTMGGHTLPKVTIKGGNSESESVFETQSIEIDITPTLETGDQNPSEAKPQAQMKLVPVWLIAAVVFLVLAILGWLLFRRFRRRENELIEEVPTLPPLEEVQIRLKELISGSTLKEGKFKVFYVELNIIMRHFFGRIYELPGDEMTSFEFETHFESVQAPSEFLSHYLDFSDLCDRVKFAKYEPSEAENTEILNLAYQLIQHLKPMCKEEEHDVAIS